MRESAPLDTTTERPAFELPTIEGLEETTGIHNRTRIDEKSYNITRENLEEKLLKIRRRDPEWARFFIVKIYGLLEEGNYLKSRLLAQVHSELIKHNSQYEKNHVNSNLLFSWCREFEKTDSFLFKNFLDALKIAHSSKKKVNPFALKSEPTKFLKEYVKLKNESPLTIPINAFCDLVEFPDTKDVNIFWILDKLATLVESDASNVLIIKISHLMMGFFHERLSQHKKALDSYLLSLTSLGLMRSIYLLECIDRNTSDIDNIYEDIYKTIVTLLKEQSPTQLSNHINNYILLLKDIGSLNSLLMTAKISILFDKTSNISPLKGGIEWILAKIEKLKEQHETLPYNYYLVSARFIFFFRKHKSIKAKIKEALLNTKKIILDFPEQAKLKDGPSADLAVWIIEEISDLWTYKNDIRDKKNAIDHLSEALSPILPEPPTEHCRYSDFIYQLLAALITKSNDKRYLKITSEALFKKGLILIKFIACKLLAQKPGWLAREYRGAMEDTLQDLMEFFFQYTDSLNEIPLENFEWFTENIIGLLSDRAIELIAKNEKITGLIIDQKEQHPEQTAEILLRFCFKTSGKKLKNTPELIECLKTIRSNSILLKHEDTFRHLQKYFQEKGISPKSLNELFYILSKHGDNRQYIALCKVVLEKLKEYHNDKLIKLEGGYNYKGGTYFTCLKICVDNAAGEIYKIAATHLLLLLAQRDPEEHHDTEIGALIINLKNGILHHDGYIDLAKPEIKCQLIADMTLKKENEGGKLANACELTVEQRFSILTLVIKYFKIPSINLYSNCSPIKHLVELGCDNSAAIEFTELLISRKVLVFTANSDTDDQSQALYLDDIIPHAIKNIILKNIMKQPDGVSNAHYFILDTFNSPCTPKQIDTLRHLLKDSLRGLIGFFESRITGISELDAHAIPGAYKPSSINPTFSPSAPPLKPEDSITNAHKSSPNEPVTSPSAPPLAPEDLLPKVRKSTSTAPTIHIPNTSLYPTINSTQSATFEPIFAVLFYIALTKNHLDSKQPESAMWLMMDALANSAQFYTSPTKSKTISTSNTIADSYSDLDPKFIYGAMVNFLDHPDYITISLETKLSILNDIIRMVNVRAEKGDANCKSQLTIENRLFGKRNLASLQKRIIGNLNTSGTTPLTHPLKK